ncbi:MAG: peptidoglycan DD-metalloendopeptidase family protein [Bacteroidetes bacterium]|nr:peptidoglycan DD-metalloendopeptidase family protein [Bacteroidota bacterium]
MSAFVKKISILITVLLMMTGSVLVAQNKKELENKKAKLQKEIDFTNKQLKIVEKNKNATAEQLGALRKKIQLREALIGTINSEISVLGGEIASTGKEINNLEEQLQQLRNEYASMIRYAWKNRNVYQQLMFVFAANDFNQAYKRMKYLQQYGEYRRLQADQITNTQNQLNGKKTELEQRKEEKTSLRNTEQKQKSTLLKEKQDQDKLLKNLTDREKRLRKELADKQAAKQKLDRAIEKIIRKEIEAAKKKATAAGKKNVTNSNVFTLTPEAAKLSNSFSGNKGALPWPVEQGIITGTFGEHPHKEFKNIVIKNNGLDIQSAKGARARAIFEGTVSGIVSIPGAGKAVIIRHGDYLTVYSNMETVSVSSGDKVSTKQAIGTIGTSSEESRGEIHLEIWKNTSKLDPKVWLAKR